MKNVLLPFACGLLILGLLGLSGCLTPSDHSRELQDQGLTPLQAESVNTTADATPENRNRPWNPNAQAPHRPEPTDDTHEVAGDHGWQPSPAPTAIVPPAGALLELGFPQGLPQRPLALETPEYQPWTSGGTIAVRGQELFLVDEANHRVRILNRTTGLPTHEIIVGSRPHRLVVHPDGSIFVTNRHDATVSRIDGEDRDQVLNTTVGTEPWGLALSPDGGLLYVSVAGTNEVVILAPDSLAEIGRISCFERPGAIATSFLGVVAVAQRGDEVRVLLVDETTGLPQALTQSGCNGIYTKTLDKSLPWDDLVHPSRGELVSANRARSIATDPQTGALFISHLQTMSGQVDDLFFLSIKMAAELSAEQGGDDPFGGDPIFGEEGDDGYGAGGVESETPHLLRPIASTVSTVGACETCELASTWTLSLGANPTYPAPVKDPLTLEPLSALVDQPVDISHHPTHSLAFLVGKGTDNVLVLNTAATDPISAPIAIIDVGMAPTGIAFSEDGLYAYTLNSQSFDVSMVELAPLMNMPSTQATAVGTGSLDQLHTGSTYGGWNSFATLTDPTRLVHSVVAEFGEDPLPEALREGRRIFTFARSEHISHGGEFACASCHFEGGEDQMVWVIPSGLRQTPSLAQRLDGTGPFNWLGTEDELKDNMSETIERMGGVGLTESQLTSLEGFLLDGMVGLPNPHTAEDGLTEAQARGAALFHDPTVGCASCHTGATTTDGLLHDVGTINPMELEIEMLVSDFVGVEISLGSFNTPSLRGLFATAPYLHDGSAATLFDVLDRTATTMGYTAHLSLEDKQDLVAYLLTL